MLASKSRIRLSPVERRRLIADRQKSSLFWKTMHVFGSMKLALFLLAAISIACATATIMESKFTTEIAQAYIYKAPWFMFWLALLSVNLFAATITRWPWMKRHTGFIITHYGIITLLVGAVIGNRLGFEGNVTLTKGAPPATRVITSKSVLQIESPSDGGIYLWPYNGATERPSEKHPDILKLPGSDLKLVIDRYAAQIQREPHIVASPDGQPAVLLRLQSNMMGQPISVPLGTAPGTEQNYDFFGMAHIVFLDALPTDEASAQRETRMIFSKFAPVSQPGDTSPLIVTLSEDGKTIAFTDPKGHGLSYDRAEIQGKEISTPLGNVKVVQYWPDFEFKDGKPTTLSQEPNNPAALVFLDVPPATIASQTTEPKSDAKPLLEVAMGKDGLDYRVSRNGFVSKSGSVKQGESFALGWGDWVATPEAIEEKGRLEEKVVPVETTPQSKEGIPGLRARLQSPSGERGEPVWLESGNIGTLTLGFRRVRLGYGLETRPLNFSMSLLSFEVPRDEGTEKPSDFVSKVLFVGEKPGDRREAMVHMNHPASYPGKWWNLATGVNYKFSQAQWNPKNLDETTYQVLYDPGWLFKWIGSLAVCAGIAITFYWKPKSS